MDNPKEYSPPQEGGPRPFFGYVPARIPEAFDVVNVSEDPWGECVHALVLPLTDAAFDALRAWIEAELREVLSDELADVATDRALRGLTRAVRKMRRVA
jgi:hypothetical protein